MYNGIGLSSVRGMATSGYVQANSSHVRNNRVRRERERNVSQRPPSYNPVSAVARVKNNEEIQKHERLRRLENSLLEYRFELEEKSDSNKDLTPDEIDNRVQKERERRTRSGAEWKWCHFPDVRGISSERGGAKKSFGGSSAG